LGSTRPDAERSRASIPLRSGAPSGNTATEEGTRAFVRRRLQRLAENNGWAGGLFYRGSLAGEIGYDYIDWPNRCTEIGYWVGAAFEGKGLVSRACRTLAQHAFAELGVHRVQIRCASDNTRSRTIPERLGFRQEGVLRGIERLHICHAIWTREVRVRSPGEIAQQSSMKPRTGDDQRVKVSRTYWLEAGWMNRPPGPSAAEARGVPRG
jgi:ribosomal-protein-serine acetyltransferase